MVSQQHLARYRDVPAADQPHVRDRMMRGRKRTRRDQRRVIAGEAGDMVEARVLRALARVMSGGMAVSLRQRLV